MAARSRPLGKRLPLALDQVERRARLIGRTGGITEPIRNAVKMSKNSGTVLVVDDDAAVRSSLKFALEVEGFSVRLYDRPAALLADENLPRCGCLVVDYRMPGMDGLQLVDALRARGVVLPAILITVRANKQLRIFAAKSGIDYVLEKPLSDGALVESIRSALGTCD
jgi:two-component system response regulator FixJ